MRQYFNGSVLRSYLTQLGTASGLQRVSLRANLDYEHAELPGFHYGHDGSLDAPDFLPTGSTVAEFKPGYVCDTRPEMVYRDARYFAGRPVD